MVGYQGRVGVRRLDPVLAAAWSPALRLLAWLTQLSLHR